MSSKGFTSYLYDFNYASHSVPCEGFAMREFWSQPTLTSIGRCNYEPFCIFYNTLNMVESINCTVSRTAIRCATTSTRNLWPLQKKGDTCYVHARCPRTHRQNNNPPADYIHSHFFILVPTNTKNCWPTPAPASTCMLTLLLRLSMDKWRVPTVEHFWKHFHLFVRCRVQCDASWVSRSICFGDHWRKCSSVHATAIFGAELRAYTCRLQERHQPKRRWFQPIPRTLFSRKPPFCPIIMPNYCHIIQAHLFCITELSKHGQGEPRNICSMHLDTNHFPIITIPILYLLYLDRH